MVRKLSCQVDHNSKAILRRKPVTHCVSGFFISFSAQFSISIITRGELALKQMIDQQLNLSGNYLTAEMLKNSYLGETAAREEKMTLNRLVALRKLQ